MVLIGAALIAFAWANSPWSPHYFAILDIPVAVGAGAWSLEKPLILWVNDLLMAVFFFLVGLEIKRECWSASSPDGARRRCRSPARSAA